MSKYFTLVLSDPGRDPALALALAWHGAETLALVTK